MSDSWAKLQAIEERYARLAKENAVLEERYQDLQISNKSNVTKLARCRERCEQLQHENDRLQDKVRRYEAIIESWPARRLP